MQSNFLWVSLMNSWICWNGIQHFFQPTSESLNLNINLIEDAVSFYYSELRKTLSNLKFHNIQVESVGSFKIKYNELPKLIKKYEKHLAVITPDTFAQMSIKKDIEEKLSEVLHAYELLKEDYQRKKDFLKLKKNGFKKNMEK